MTHSAIPGLVLNYHAPMEAVSKQTMSREHFENFLETAHPRFVSKQPQEYLGRMIILGFAAVFAFVVGQSLLQGDTTLVSILFAVGVLLFVSRMAWPALQRPARFFVVTDDALFGYRGGELFRFPWSLVETIESAPFEGSPLRGKKKRYYLRLNLRSTAVEACQYDLEWAESIHILDDDEQSARRWIGARMEGAQSNAQPTPMLVHNAPRKRNAVIAAGICAAIVIVEIASYFVTVPGLVASSREIAIALCGIGLLYNLRVLMSEPRALLELSLSGVRIFPREGVVEEFTIPWEEVDDVYLERLQGDDDDTETFVFKVLDAGRYEQVYSAFNRLVGGGEPAEDKIHVSYEVVTPEASEVLRNCKAFKTLFAES